MAIFPLVTAGLEAVGSSQQVWEELAQPDKALRVETLHQARAVEVVARALSGRLVVRVGQTSAAMVALARHHQLRALR